MPVMKKAARKAMKASSYRHFTEAEKKFVKESKAAGLSPSEVADELERDVSSVARHFKNSGSPAGLVGRPAALTKQVIDKLVATAASMTKAAESKYQVTASMVKKALKLKCCDRVILNALHQRGVSFHPMREKPVRTEQDEKDRLKFAKTHAEKPASFWEKSVDAYMDNKYFPVYLTGAARTYAAKRTPRGSFRGKGEGLAKGHVKPKKNLKQNFGKGVLVGVALSSKKVLMCHVVRDRWNAAEACSMYKDALLPALKASNPRKKAFTLLEDNDPSGYKSKSAVTAKVDCKINVLAIPKRSPDLNPLDYGFWSLVNIRLRAQEAKFPAYKKEARNAFTARLRRTILRVPAAVLAPLVKSMRRRCAALRAAKGADFEE